MHRTVSHANGSIRSGHKMVAGRSESCTSADRGRGLCKLMAKPTAMAIPEEKAGSATGGTVRRLRQSAAGYSAVPALHPEPAYRRILFSTAIPWRGTLSGTRLLARPTRLRAHSQVEGLRSGGSCTAQRTAAMASRMRPVMFRTSTGLTRSARSRADSDQDSAPAVFRHET